MRDERRERDRRFHVTVGLAVAVSVLVGVVVGLTGAPVAYGAGAVLVVFLVAFVFLVRVRRGR